MIDESNQTESQNNSKINFKCKEKDCFYYHDKFVFQETKDIHHEKYHYCSNKSLYFTEIDGKLFLLKRISIDYNPSNQKRLGEIEKRIKCWGYGYNDMVLRPFDPQDCKDYIDKMEAFLTIFPFLKPKIKKELKKK